MLPLSARCVRPVVCHEELGLAPSFLCNVPTMHASASLQIISALQNWTIDGCMPVECHAQWITITAGREDLQLSGMDHR